MKQLCLMFAAFVLILSARPCCADRDCESRIDVKHEQRDKQSSKEKECAGCSPFFSCGSCIGFIIAKSVVHTISLIAEQPERSYTPYCQPAHKDIALAIWQPPRLS
ncbi:hypothetical protein [Mucilaginibacter lacusdianchii]|uniref:hypothetical protein n=1 Tax=Mucilaginibacter lacusdianchii TaxID=2684211 RepID=UPI00131EAA86|nr:hypothetical protein [Mucilaginibacter sp. JXJ CY 39]